MKRYLLIGAAALAFAGCSKEAAPPPPAPAEPEVAAPTQSAASERLDQVLAAQDEQIKARYAYRHPKETLEFFGIEPGMTVADTLPDEVWYAGMLRDYLGPDGKVIAMHYSRDMLKGFGQYAPDAKTIANWTKDFTAKLESKRDEGDAAVAAIHYGEIPDEMAGSVDVVLMVRALHHFNRMEGKRKELTKALADINKLLKPGGIAGVVQHRAPEQSDDKWATGEAGYVKQSAVVAAFEQAGFELIEASEINANPNDQPGEKDMVWRLPPTLMTGRDNPEVKAQMEAIGESDRMTLKFRKPEAAG